jgi:alkaline phosphatase D
MKVRAARGTFNGAMKTVGPLVFCALVIAACGPDVWAYDDFNFDAANWGIEGQTLESSPTLDKTHGNPPGSICGSDNADPSDAPWKFVAPPKYKGDASRFHGRRLTWDAVTSETLFPIGGKDGPPVDAVQLSTNGLTIAAPTDLKQRAGSSWTALSVSLDMDSPWHHLDAAMTPATETEIESVLANLTTVVIRGEWSADAEVSCIDNVYFGIR